MGSRGGERGSGCGVEGPICVALGTLASIVQKKWKERAPGWGLEVEGPKKVNVCGSGTLGTVVQQK